MTDVKDTTAQTSTKQPNLIKDLEAFANTPTTATGGLKFSEIPPREYNTEIIDNFLATVFHAELADDENILTWQVNPTRAPAFPIADNELLDRLDKTRKPKALYFATATCKQEDDGSLRSRKKLFKSLRVVVLDDIGTKIPMDKIPADFPPSYKIESSAGNFQYGYVLAEPVTNLSAADALIQLVYESGYSDNGGKTPVKLVRLPEGVNGKKGIKGGFVSDLVSLTDTVYTPQEILDNLKLNVQWEDVLTDADAVTKRRASKSLGTTPWASTAPQAQAMNGFIDPVLEWLIETGQVIHDNCGDWVDVVCPWADTHTTGSDIAGYAPLGRGDDVECRAFNCFHGHCADRSTVDYLQYVAANAGIQAGVRDPAAALTTRYVFDKMANAAWDIKSSKRDICVGMASFKTLYPHSTEVQLVNGKSKLIGMTSLWNVSPSRVVVAGTTYDPATTARIVSKQGENYVNLFSIPEWGHGPIDRLHVDKFMDYVNYLVPDQQARDYFLQWTAAKLQDMSFRGAAIVMVAHKQGVGRSTMADMLKTLMGENNAADVPLASMIGDSAFNEWQEKPFIVSEETLTGDPKKFYNTYEKLKTFIDPRSRTITINPKFGLKREVEVHGSYLFLTNHHDAIAIPEEDRRFFVLDNAPTPAKPPFFTAVNKWLSEEDSDGMPLWARHVYRWLQTIEVDLEVLNSPPPRTLAKKAMVNASVNNLDFATKMIMDIWPDPYINASEVFQVLNDPYLAGPLRFDEDTNKKFVKTAVNMNSTAYACQGVKNPNGLSGKVRVRVTDKAWREGLCPPIDGDESKIHKRLTVHYAARQIDYRTVAGEVLELLREDDRL